MGRLDLSGKTALVTGAASGIGRETAVAFARAGADLVVCDVNERGLEDVAGAIKALGRAVLARRVDVSKAEEVRALADAVHAERPAVDVLMNNAGVAVGGTFVDTPLEDWQWLLSINVWGVVHGCHYFLPAMIRRGQGGHVVNVASAAGYVASSQLTAYATTKFAVVGLSEALRDELLPHGIAVTTVCPGIINTPITTTARMRGVDSAAARKALVDMYARRNYGPDRVATNILKAIARKRAVAPISPEAWVMYYLKRLAPGLTARLNRLATQRMDREVQRAVRST
jgi:NAD(P)-dependent dehydrogenase (short-subunit alcohol dehydrogenase family)